MIPEPKPFVEEVLNKANLASRSIEANDHSNNLLITTPPIEINRVIEPILAKNLHTLSAVGIEWVVEGLLAKNYMTLFAAREKMGKTTLIKGLLKSVARGEQFIGQNTKKVNTLVITEENAGHWMRRMEDMDLIDCENIWFIPQPFNSRQKIGAWEKFINKDISGYCNDLSIDLLILDTISPIWPVNDENNASEVQTALLPLVSIAKLGVAVMAVHHFSKAGGARGSTVISAVPDVLIDFMKPQGDEETRRRVLKCRSRFEESPEQLLVDYVNGQYVLLGTPQDVAKKERTEKVASVLQDFPNGATINEIITAWSEDKKPSRSMLKIYLNELLFKGIVALAGEKEIRGGKAIIYKLNPDNDENWRGQPINKVFEANNPNNFDTGSIENNEVDDETEIESL